MPEPDVPEPDEASDGRPEGYDEELEFAEPDDFPEGVDE